MRVSLKNNAIFVQSSQDYLDNEWMEDFFDEHIQNTLFLENGLLVLNNEKHLDKKDRFLDNLSQDFGKTNELASPFYQRSLKKCKSAAVRIEVPYKKPEKIEIDLYAYNSTRVKLSFNSNRWITRFLVQQLNPFVLSSSTTMVYIDVTTQKAKSRLEKVLDRKKILHFNIEYKYDNNFITRLYSHFQGWNFNNSEMDKMIRYYSLFELQLGQRPHNQKLLKKQYLQLAKKYHPDNVHGKHPSVINDYTKKFQLIQEAYDVLKEEIA